MARKEGDREKCSDQCSNQKSSVAIFIGKPIPRPVFEQGQPSQEWLEFEVLLK
jgi:hypothetical protein